MLLSLINLPQGVYFMHNDSRKIQNKQYLWASRFAFWLCVLIALPLFIFQFFEKNPTVANAFTVLLYCYIALGNYILGYRIENPPKWAYWVLPEKWISEWQYLVFANPEDTKSNKKGLIRVIGGAALLTILLLAFLSGKL